MTTDADRIQGLLSLTITSAVGALAVLQNKHPRDIIRALASSFEDTERHCPWPHLRPENANEVE